MTLSFAISLLDRDILQHLGNHFNCKVYLHHRKNKAPCHILSIPTKYCEYFRELGYSQGAKTFDVHIPEVPEYNLKYLLRGMIDGDGTIRKGINDFEVRFFSVSKTLFNQYKTIIEKLGYKYGISTHPKYGESTISVSSLDFLLWLYSDRLDLCISRKLQIVNDKVDDIVHTYSIVKNRRM